MFKPFNISKNVAFTYSQSTLNDIKSRNPSFTSKEFYLPVNDDRPFLILLAALIGPSGLTYDTGNQNLTALEFSSLYSGNSKKLLVKHKPTFGKTQVGQQTGGYVENFAFGGKFICKP